MCRSKTNIREFSADFVKKNHVRLPDPAISFLYIISLTKNHCDVSSEHCSDYGCL